MGLSRREQRALSKAARIEAARVREQKILDGLPLSEAEQRRHRVNMAKLKRTR